MPRAIQAATAWMKYHAVELTLSVTTVCYIGLLWFSAARRGSLHTGDTDNLVSGARYASECVRDGRWKACGLIQGSRFSWVFPYPLLQYVPALLLVRLKWSDSAIIGALGRINIVAFAGILLLCYVAGRKFEGRYWSPLLVLAALSSSLTFQSTAGFSESIAAFVTLASVVAVLYRKRLLIVFTVAVACSAKETMAPFLLLFGILMGRSKEDKWLPPGAIVAPLLGGLAIGEAIVTGFNVFRFGQAKNLFYLDPLFRVPGTGRKALYLIGEWLSPSSGLAAYWPVATLIVATALLAGSVTAVRARSEIRLWLPPLVAVLGTIVFTAGLAAWVSPFGWIAYGPRLAVPIMPAAVVSIAGTTGPLLRERALLLFRRGGSTHFGLAFLLCVIAYPQLGSPWSAGRAIGALIAPDSACPAMTSLAVQRDAARYYRCTTHVMWRVHPSPIRQAISGGGAVATAARLLGCGIIAIAVLDARRLALKGTPPEIERA